MKTWKEFKNEHLSDFPDDIIEEVRKVTSFARQYERVKEVANLGYRYLHDTGMHPVFEHHVRALCALEAFGTRGGGLYCPGAGAQRHSAFKSLPRRDSNAGKVWTSAILEFSGTWYWAANKDELCIAVLVDNGDMKFVPISKISDGNECSLVAARRAIRAVTGMLWRNPEDPENVHPQQTAAEIIRAAAKLIMENK